MNPNNPFKKNIRFGLGVIFTVIEGVLSACVYMAIYLLLQMLLNDSITIEYINNLTILIVGIFVIRLLTYAFGYTQGRLEAELFLDKFVYIWEINLNEFR